MKRALTFSVMRAADVASTRVTATYIKREILDRDLWGDLHANNASDVLRSAVRRHFADYGATIVSKIMGDFTVTDDLLRSLRSAYKAY